MIRAQVLGIKADLDVGKSTDRQGQKTILYDLLTINDLPPDDKTAELSRV